MAIRRSFQIVMSLFENFTRMKMPAGHSAHVGIWNLKVTKASRRPMWSFGMWHIFLIRQLKGIDPCVTGWDHFSRFIRNLLKTTQDSLMGTSKNY